MAATVLVRAQTLQGVRILSVMDGADRARLAARCHGLRVAAGTAVVHDSDRSGHVYAVINGRVRAAIFSRGGREVSFRDIGPGEIFGDLSAIDGKPRSASVVAVQDCELVAIPGEVFRDVLASHPRVAYQMLCDLTSQVRSLSERVVEFSTLGVKNRIHAELLRLARAAPIHESGATITPAPTHAEIASRISTHREAVTREMCRLAERGVVRKENGALRVSDVARLARMVEEAAAG